VLGDAVVATAILDRLLHDAYRVELTGEGLRKRRAAEPRTVPA
jgi:DNA replication protein DnaC